ncbi:hypothetical protein GH714_010718 [Hevea brasiliensis]|uniref:Longin domain-containing protein n=1 Tax=Hevea brasiliensis TaxID=3981 RepID=A0A6A6MEP4_HEVBR|nr:hypothetical protein GH714_010718 [Hevea brasiliensis]
MGQQSLIYSFVSCGNVILAEYTEFSGNFNSIAFQCLRKLPATNNKFTDNCDAHSFNYLVDNGYTMGRGRKRQLPELTLDVSTELPETDGNSPECCGSKAGQGGGDVLPQGKEQSTENKSTTV